MRHRRPTRRTLTKAELDLWAQVAQSVAPLAGRRRLAADLPGPIAGPPLEPHAAPDTPPAALHAKSQLATPALTPLAPLETRFRRRLARGVVEIDARIDLHGLRQEEAHRRLNAFLAGAQARGHRLILVITGKGGPSGPDRDPYGERGVLRRAVPIWLSSPAARVVVVGFETADPVHGGAGALYVRIRRAGRL